MLKMQLSRGLKNICKLQLLIMMSKYARLSPGFLPSCSTHSSKQTSSKVPLRAKSTGSSGDQGVSWVLDKSFGNFFFTRGREDETAVVEMVLKQRSGKLQKLWDLFAIPSASEKDTPSLYSTMSSHYLAHSGKWLTKQLDTDSFPLLIPPDS